MTLPEAISKVLSMPERVRDAAVAKRIFGLVVPGETLCYRDESGMSVDNVTTGAARVPEEGWSSIQPVYVVQSDDPKDTEPGELTVDGWPLYRLSVVRWYSTNPSDDYAVLVRVRETWAWGCKEWFCEATQVIWNERGQLVKPSPELMSMFYEPGDYAVAALATKYLMEGE